ncbi:hypothetical protein Pint_10652 [Pistacia integerrima]|uniref:Uncharacterized protein n=1 Tax=Pistacia integerrima TaxID=434235 RepID=A0ACC0XGV8_9ROSI|nr:hypothetical protein Pint_10652 [Pistacia integerrima]
MCSCYMNKMLLLRVENWLNCIQVEVRNVGKWFLVLKVSLQTAVCKLTFACGLRSAIANCSLQFCQLQPLSIRI